MVYIVHPVTGIFRSIQRLFHHSGQCGIAHFGLGKQPVARPVKQQFAHYLSIQNFHFRHVILTVDVQNAGIGEIRFQERVHTCGRSYGDVIAVIIIFVHVDQFFHQYAVLRIIKVDFRCHAVYRILHFNHIDIFQAIALNPFHLVDGPCGVLALAESGFHFCG